MGREGDEVFEPRRAQRLEEEAIGLDYVQRTYLRGIDGRPAADEPC
jgi:hypothetical protein